MPKIYVGCSGWTFPGWRGTFYPKGLPQKEELEYASRKLSSIEINGTFYSLQKPETYQRWYDETPGDFVFSIKAPQFITHIRRLKDIEGPLSYFLGSGLLGLKQKLGAVLWQFPPNVMLKDDRFEKFLKMLPHDFKGAARIARKHPPRMKNFPLRHAFEFRHPSFKNPEFVALMRKHGVAIVFAHCGDKSPFFEDVTADFIYARMHGQDPKYKKGYTKDTLSWWADRVEGWIAAKKDAFIYFDTEAKKYAPQDALNFSRLVGI